jgi:hypothetical protein
MLLRYSFSTTTLDHTHVSKCREQSENLAELIISTHCTAQILLPHISTSLELSKMPSARKGLGMLMRLFKLAQKGVRCSFFLTGAGLLEVVGDCAEKLGV